MTEAPEPPLEAYVRELEARYGQAFSLERISDEELITLEHLSRGALESEQGIDDAGRRDLAPLAALIELQRSLRGLRTQDG
jgi:hypothetical protein